MTFRLALPLATAIALLVAAAAPLAPAGAQSLRGSRVKVERVHNHAVRAGFDFFRTPAEVRAAAKRGELVRLRGNGDYRVNAGVRFPYVKEEVRTFVERLGAQYRATCGEPLVVTSAVRPMSDQPANASDRSVHPTGMAIDLRKPRTARCLTWLRKALAGLQSQGVVEPTEEFRPPHFHVAVFPVRYDRYVAAHADGGAAAAEAAPRAGTPTRVASDGSTKRAAAKTTVGTRRHRVRRGESLWTIARRNRTSVATLKQINRLGTSEIRAGQTILVPAR